MTKTTKLSDEERLKRVFSSILFLVASAYMAFTIRANQMTGWFNLVLIIPFFLMFVCFFESIFCYCVLKDKRTRQSIKIYAHSLILSFLTSLLFVFV